jgi:hypothetical protein
MATKELEARPRLQRRSWGSVLARVLVLLVGFLFMVGFAVALAKITLEPSKASVDLTHTNMRPGDSIRMYLDQPAFRDTVKQIGGNLLLGVPFGVLLPVLIPKARGLLRVVFVTALVMLCVETAQGMLVEGRAFDIDDVILNTLGALVGYLLLGRRLGRALHPRRTHWYQRRRTADSEKARREPAADEPVRRERVKRERVKGERVKAERVKGDRVRGERFKGLRATRSKGRSAGPSTAPAPWWRRRPRALRRPTSR